MVTSFEEHLLVQGNAKPTSSTVRNPPSSKIETRLSKTGVNGMDLRRFEWQGLFGPIERTQGISLSLSLSLSFSLSLFLSPFLAGNSARRVPFKVTQIPSSTILFLTVSRSMRFFCERGRESSEEHYFHQPDISAVESLSGFTLFDILSPLLPCNEFFKTTDLLVSFDFDDLRKHMLIKKKKNFAGISIARYSSTPLKIESFVQQSDSMYVTCNYFYASLSLPINHFRWQLIADHNE